MLCPPKNGSPIWTNFESFGQKTNGKNHIENRSYRKTEALFCGDWNVTTPLFHRQNIFTSLVLSNVMVLSEGRSRKCVDEIKLSAPIECSSLRNNCEGAVQRHLVKRRKIMRDIIGGRTYIKKSRWQICLCLCHKSTWLRVRATHRENLVYEDFLINYVEY